MNKNINKEAKSLYHNAESINGIKWKINRELARE